MSNIFRFTPINYFQTPNALVDDKIGALNLAPLKVYLYVLRMAQQMSNTTVELDSEAIMLRLSIGKNSLTRARAELKKHRLVDSKEINSAGVWSYTVLDFGTGQPIPKPGPVDFNSFSPKQVTHYFEHHLADYDPVPTENGGLKARCPFHNSSKERTKPLSVTFTDGGVWNCFVCNKTGKLVDFELEMALRSQRLITRKQAHGNVRRIVSQAELAPYRDNDVTL